MLVKCETKSQRVKSISFHPKMNMVLAGLHSGVIQLWDYRVGILIDRFEEHEGPVRGVNFHSTQPLFVSGGDDYLIKVWNFHLKKCVFNLIGHLDYIRKVQFHLEYPWILSASDDQTIRIWNWQSRSCIAILTGHNHYVMCAEFHPTLDLIISGSLDKTLRVWDIKVLREKNVISKSDNILIDKPYGISKGIYNADFLKMANNVNSSGYPFMSNQLSHSNVGGNQGMCMRAGGGGNYQNINNNMFTASDAVCKFVLEGHEKGINCCTFHHKLPIIASGSDDKLVKLWRFNDSKFWEVDTLRGHFNNVSSLLFHRTKDELLLSNSEDRTIRIWDINKRTCIHTFRRENDRFWILAFKPNSNLIGVGHDSGMVIFKFEKEKTPFDKYKNSLFYCKEKYIHMYDVITNNDWSICVIRKCVNAMISGYHKLIFNQFNMNEIMIILIYKEEEEIFTYDIITCDIVGGRTSLKGRESMGPSYNNTYAHWNKGGAGVTEAMNSPTSPNSAHVNDFKIDNVRCIVKNKHCLSATFLSRNKYVFVEKKNSNYILNIHNLPDDNLYKKVEMNFKIEHVHSLNNNKILIFGENRVYLYDINLKKVLNQLHHTDSILSVEVLNEYVAFIYKYNIVITTIDLNYLCTAHEYVRIKSGVWDTEHSVLIYNTFSHLKYILVNGENGLIKYMDEPVYLFKIYNNHFYYIDRRQNIGSEFLNDSEYLFKLAIINNDEELACHYLEESNNMQQKLQKQSMKNIALGTNENEAEYMNLMHKKRINFSYNLIGYIRKKGFANLAIRMVNNSHTLFNLSIQLGNLYNALKAAKKIDKPHIWNMLSTHSLMLGNFEIAEYSLQKMKAYEKLSFLYFFSGNIEKLKKMLSISIIRNDFISVFLNALYLGDIEQRINIFIQQNQLHLALLCSHLYNIPINISDKQCEFDINECNYCPKKSYYLSPPIPIVKIEEQEITRGRGGRGGNAGRRGKGANKKTQRDKTATWCNSYNWPTVNVEPLYKKERASQKKQFGKTNMPEFTHEKKDRLGEAPGSYMQNRYTDQFADSSMERKRRQNETSGLEVGEGDQEEDLFNQSKTDQKNYNSDVENDIWGDNVNDEDIEIEMEMNMALNTNAHSEESKTMHKKMTKIERGESPIEKTLKNNPKIIDFIKAGSIQTALKLISKKFGIVNVAPLKPIIKNIYIATYAYVTPMQNALPLKICITTNESNFNNTYITKHFLLSQIKKAHKLVTLGKFSLALNLFRNVLYHIIFVDSTPMEKEMMEFLNMCVNYILAMRLEDERNKTATEDPRRSLELMAYFTCCSLQNSHLYLVLRRGMGLAWKAQNYITAGSFAKRLINGNYENIKGSEEEIAKAKKILYMCEHKSTEQYNIDYDPNDYGSIRICCMSLKKIQLNEATVNCPLCLSVAKAEFSSTICANCEIAKLGVKTLGFDFITKNV